MPAKPVTADLFSSDDARTNKKFRPHSDLSVPPYDRSKNIDGCFAVMWLTSDGVVFSSRCRDLGQAMRISRQHKRVPSWIIAGLEREIDTAQLCLSYAGHDWLSASTLDTQVRRIIKVVSAQNIPAPSTYIQPAKARGVAPKVLGRSMYLGSMKTTAAMDADQTALIRLFRRLWRDSMSVTEIEKHREGQTAWFKKFLEERGVRSVKDKQKTTFTLDDILGSKLSIETKTGIEKTIEEMVRFRTVDFSEQDTALGLPTKAWVGYIPVNEIERVFEQFGPRAHRWLRQSSSEQMRQMQRAHGHPHPDAGPNTLTIGWVRYTPVPTEDATNPNTIWVEEIQTDLKTIVGARNILDNEMQRMQMEARDLEDANRRMHVLIKERQNEMDALLDNMEWMLFKSFVEQFHGSHEIVMPTYNYRATIPGYPSNPVSVYNDIPRKARMTKKPVQEYVDVKPYNLQPGEVWVAKANIINTVQAETLENAAKRILKRS